MSFGVFMSVCIQRVEHVDFGCTPCRVHGSKNANDKRHHHDEHSGAHGNLERRETLVAQRVHNDPAKSEPENYAQDRSQDGEQGQGSGRMPGFGQMYTDEQVKLIVEYVRSL